MQKDKNANLKICPNCGAFFVPDNCRQKYCGVQCRNAVANHKRESEALHEERFCEWCGKKFVTNRAGQKYCSARCRDRRRLDENRKVNPNLERVRSERDKTVNLYTLIKRDKNICQICGRECDLYDYEMSETGLMMCGESYPTIDHIKPCSKGGSHTWDNVQLACRKCNITKGDKYE